MEKTIRLIGPRSLIEVLPHISVEKYLATEEPKKAVADITWRTFKNMNN